MSILNQRNFIFNINDLNTKQQKRNIFIKNDKVKVNKSNEYYNDRNVLNN